jgi:hypothetical protein
MKITIYVTINASRYERGNITVGSAVSLIVYDSLRPTELPCFKLNSCLCDSPTDLDDGPSAMLPVPVILRL